jgi:two-component system cell cycle response regulator
VTISIGVAATLGAGDTAQALLKRADRAVYEAKAAGRNVVVARAA